MKLGSIHPPKATKQATQGRPPLLQRACACGKHSSHECQDCKKKRDPFLQRFAAPNARGAFISQPGDPFEREAERVADAVTRGPVSASVPQPGRSEAPVAVSGRALFRQASGGGGALAQLGTVLPAARELQGTGVALDGASRGFMESRFGRDFSAVRVHAGPRAAEVAESVHALAFTVGEHIVFGEGRYSPTSAAGRHLLAHELAHVAQQADHAAPHGIYRLSAALCSSSCTSPDTVGGSAPSAWKVTLAVDREEPSLMKAVSTSAVGHTWVKLSDDVGEKYSYGFWPETGFNAKKPFSSVKGCVHHPDTAHEPPGGKGYQAMDYTVTGSNYQRGLIHAQKVCRDKPDYNLFSYNCTSFAIDVTKAAGISPPSSTTLAVHNPNALYEGIEKRRGEGHPKTGAVIGGVAGLAGGIALGSLLGPAGMIVGGILGAVGGAIGGALIGDVS